MDAQARVVMLGSNVAQKLFGSTDPTGQNISIRAGRPVQLRVAGVLQSKGGGPLGNVDDQILVPLTTLQKQLANPRNPKGSANISQIVVQAASSKTINAAKSEITQLLLTRHRVSDPDFVIQTQDDQISTQTGVTQVLTILLGAIAAGVDEPCRGRAGQLTREQISGLARGTRGVRGRVDVVAPRRHLAQGGERALQLHQHRGTLGVPAVLIRAHPLHAYRLAELL